MGMVRGWLVILYIITGLFADPGWAAVLQAEGSESLADSMEAAGSDDSSSESFPLMQIPENSSLPLRSEQPSLADEENWHRLRAKILRDFGSRISPAFHVERDLVQRTEFWFDIYTRYGEAQHLVHHVLYPWIVYRV